jgi:hypothetical protein
MLLVVMLVMVVVMLRGEGRTGKHQQQQDSGKNLFHAMNLA